MPSLRAAASDVNNSLTRDAFSQGRSRGSYNWLTKDAFSQGRSRDSNNWLTRDAFSQGRSRSAVETTSRDYSPMQVNVFRPYYEGHPTLVTLEDPTVADPEVAQGSRLNPLHVFKYHMKMK